MVVRNICKRISIIFLLSMLTHAQTYKTVFNFQGTNGANPEAPLVQGADGNFYGTTYAGGTWPGNGTIFRITPQGKLTTIYTFRGYPYDGANPAGGLILGTDGNFYGTTVYGGNARCNTVYDFGCGTVFQVTPSGELTTLHNFARTADSNDGIFPMGQLVQGMDGNFYGTTYQGGLVGSGTVFKITPAGTIATLYNFCTQYQCTDGYYPAAGLALGNDGNFYGTTSSGGSNTNGYDGTVFKITPDGRFAILHSFDGYDGNLVLSPLIRGNDGNFYGTTAEGGLNLFSDGTVFRITPDGEFTLLVSFASDYLAPYVYGFHPFAGLVQGTDENLYGVNFEGGDRSGCYNPGGCGTVFNVTPGRIPNLLYSFGGHFDGGANPDAPIIQGTDGNFYGTTQNGGPNPSPRPAYGFGTVFRLSTGLPPFVALVQTFGKVGQTIGILGQDFTGANEVSFNGTTATFNVVSDTYIEATVPDGVTNGRITVETQSGELKSNTLFQIIH